MFVPIGEDALVETLDPLRLLGGGVTLAILISTLQEPMASAVYRQKMGTVEVDESRLERGASDTRAFPIKEYSGAGES